MGRTLSRAERYGRISLMALCHFTSLMREAARNAKPLVSEALYCILIPIIVKKARNYLKPFTATLHVPTPSRLMQLSRQKIRKCVWREVASYTSWHLRRSQLIITVKVIGTYHSYLAHARTCLSPLNGARVCAANLKCCLELCAPRRAVVER